MADIVEQLRAIEAWIRKPETNTFNLTTDVFDEAAAEIERLRARLEIDPSHPYDGIYARDETIRQQDKQIERLRAALREIVSLDDEPKCCGKGIAGYDNPPECCGDPERGIDRAQSIARAALEGRSCTCHPSEAPTPCQRKYALDDCIKTALEGRT